jgi:hypothetical protein
MIEKPFGLCLSLTNADDVTKVDNLRSHKGRLSTDPVEQQADMGGRGAQSACLTYY